MKHLRELLASTIGRKGVVAVTGLALTLFLIAHLLGNLLVFGGPDAINHYALTLHSRPGLVWGARIGLLIVFVAHIWASLSLQVRARSARPIPYTRAHAIRSTLASRTMVLTGALVLAFLAYHLLHFTLGVTDPQAFANVTTIDGHETRDVHAMVIQGFQVKAVSCAYILAMIVLAFHLTHGVQSVVQTLGFHHPVYTPVIRRLGTAFAILLALGNCSIPIAVLSGVLRSTTGGN